MGLHLSNRDGRGSGLKRGLVGVCFAGVVWAVARWALLAAPSDATRGFEPPSASVIRLGHQVEWTLAAAPATLDCLPGQKTPGLAYNGSFPGPTLELVEGDHVTVHFSNHLDEPTNVHFHGMHIPPDQDGGPTNTVPPGAGRDYVFDVPAGSAGTYWYHPHPHGATGAQVQAGLAGAIRVHAARPSLSAAFGDTLLLLSDGRFEADGSLAPLDQIDLLSGRVGPVLFVNGRVRPTLTLRPGEWRRLRLVDGAPARYYMLTAPGCELVQVGSDDGLFEHPRPLSRLLLAPGERMEVLLHAPARRGTFALALGFYDRGTGGDMPDALDTRPSTPVQGYPSVFCVSGVGPAGSQARASRRLERQHSLFATSRAPVPLLALVVSGPALQGQPALPARLRVVAPIALSHAHTRELVLDDDPRMGLSFDHHRFRMDHIDAWTHLGDTEIWHVINRDDLDHPFHLHGFQFQVLARGGHPEPYVAWKDTVNVPTNSDVRLAVVFRDFVGDRVYHCHILAHEDMGMMGWLRVLPPG